MIKPRACNSDGLRTVLHGCDSACELTTSLIAVYTLHGGVFVGRGWQQRVYRGCLHHRLHGLHDFICLHPVDVLTEQQMAARIRCGLSSLACFASQAYFYVCVCVCCAERVHIHGVCEAWIFRARVEGDAAVDAARISLCCQPCVCCAAALVRTSHAFLRISHGTKCRCVALLVNCLSTGRRPSSMPAQAHEL